MHYILCIIVTVRQLKTASYKEMYYHWIPGPGTHILEFHKHASYVDSIKDTKYALQIHTECMLLVYSAYALKIII